jgi:two-component system, chemotaxis family, sensor kinase CheA
MYIEDAELRDLYKGATAERLQTLEAELLHLEKHPSDRDQLESFLREAHTLKGDSRMLGVMDVETLIHQMEDQMEAVKRGEREITSELCDRLYQGMDAIRKLVSEAVTGQPSGVNTFLVLAQLMGSQSHESQAEVTPVKEIPIAEPVQSFDDFVFDDLFTNDLATNEQPIAIEAESVAIGEQPTAIEKQPAQIKTAAKPETTETIRVEAEKLDILMRQSGELSSTNLRIARRLVDIEEILELYEDWSHDTSANHLTVQQIGANVNTAAFPQVQGFWKRNNQRLEKLGNLVNHLKSAASEDTARLESLSNQLESGIQNLRLLPLATVFNLFPRLVRDLAKDQDKKVKLELEGGETRVDKRILEEIKDPLLHLIRNAIDHGIETPTEREQKGKSDRAIVRLKGYQQGDSIIIEVRDDGRGLDIESIKQTAIRRGIASDAELAAMSTQQIQSLIFSPGFSTRTEVSAISGRGIGLDVVRANIERLQGTIEVEFHPDRGCVFRLRISTNLNTLHVLIAEVNQLPYAIPVEFVETMILISKQEIFALEGSQTITFLGQPISVVWLADLLELSINSPLSPQTASHATKNISCIILKIGPNYLGVMVDAILDRQDITLKPQSKLLKRLRNIIGATILGNGEICMVLNPQDLLNSVQKGSGDFVSLEAEEVDLNNKILLVEDSIIIRTQMKRLLEGAGFNVTIAVDGLEGLNKLKAGSFDAVVTDVEMPNLNGLALTTKIRQHEEYRELPIILVTTLASDEDKRRGAEVGANAYLTKGDFDQKVLIDTLQRLI